MTRQTHVPHIAVCLTCFNRREKTMRCLQTLFKQQGLSELDLTVFVTDDKSTDGTAQAIRDEFPQVRLLEGDGGLFWNGGMRLAFGTAMKESFDAYIWLNDDTFLDDDALARLLACHYEQLRAGQPSIVIGTVRDAQTVATTYGGWKRRVYGLHLDFVLLDPSAEQTLACDTMNGNFTLIPSAVANIVGNLDAQFVHQTTDFDYGLRAQKAGLRSVIAPGYFGTCSINGVQDTWRDAKLSMRGRLKHLRSHKGIPANEWFIYTRRHYGWRWPIYFFSPMLKALFNIHDS